MNKYFIIYFFLIPSIYLHTQESNIYKKIDSIEVLRKLSKDSSLDLEVRLSYAFTASKLSNETRLDSTILKSDINLSFMYLNMDKYNLYKEINYKNLKLSKKIKDSSGIAISNRSLAWYHAQEMRNDSAYHYYYNAEKIYHGLKDLKNEGEVLLNMADIQETEKDYIGSEETAVRAIKLIESLSDTQRNKVTLWSLYNLLAIVSERSNRHEEAIYYYKTCVEIANKMNNNLFYLLTSKNNMAFSYEGKGDLQRALSIYNDLINDERLLEIDPELYVIVLGNIAKTKFELDSKTYLESQRIYKRAYKISDSLGDNYGKMAILEDMSEFYLKIGKKDSALILSKENYLLSRSTNSNDIVLKSLKFMANLEGGDNGKGFLDEYIKLNDSLIEKERQARNKFARVRFEVDKVEEDNAQLSKQRLLFIIISFVLLFSLVLLYIVISQRSKNRKLEFIQQQQEANEEIYNLMLSQQDKIVEGRSHEKKRISEELHDGILGKLFGTRLSLDSLNMVQTDEAVKTRGQYISELKNIESEIRKISHDLNADFVVGSSFIDIVETLIDSQTAAYDLEHTFSNDDSIDWEDVPNKTKIHIYRMLQETMQNIYKHAGANTVKISFQLKNNVILCTIEDDGSGFNIKKARKGIGLKNIDSRVREVGGKAEVFSKIDIGTIIKISIPIN